MQCWLLHALGVEACSGIHYNEMVSSLTDICSVIGFNHCLFLPFFSLSFPPVAATGRLLSPSPSLLSYSIDP
jgi:hypothetical protein